MATKFKYVAVTPGGRKISGMIEAEDEMAVRLAIDSKGMIPLSVVRRKKNFKSLRLLAGSSVNRESLIFFARKMLTLSRAGIPILRSLDIIIEDTGDKKLSEVLREIRKSIEGGGSLADALSAHEGYFPTLFIEAVSAGEESGTLEIMLSRTMELLEREARIKDNIKAAVRYPAFIMITIALAFTVVITMVIPKFTSLYSAYGARLPWATRLLIETNAFIKAYWPVMILILPAVGLMLWRLRLTRWGKRGFDYFILSFPIIGMIIVKAAMSRMCYTLSTLLAAGLPLSRALTILKSSVGNYYFSKVIGKMGENLSGGGDLLDPIRESKFFSPLVVQMFAIGLESGSMEAMLSETASHFDAEIEYDTKKLTSRIEPILTVMIAVVVLILALAIFTPMWNMIEVFKR